MKKLKYLLMAMLVSCAFVFAGCFGGDGQLDVEASANVGDTEAYTAAEATDLESFNTIVNNAEATGVNAYRMTLSMNEEGMQMDYNAIFAVVEEDLQFAIQLVMTMPAEQEGEEGVEVVIKMWIKEGIVYMDMNTEEGTQKVKMSIESKYAESLLAMMAALEQFNLDELLDALKELDFTAEGTSLKVNKEDENVARFEVSYDGSTIYVVFENGKLQGVKAVVGADEEAIEVSISAFNGAIEFPDADSFEEMPEIGA